MPLLTKRCSADDAETRATFSRRVRAHYVLKEARLGAEERAEREDRLD